MRLASAAHLTRVLDRVTALGSWLVLGLSAALFAQWPLRELVGAGAALSNDLGQIVFALYVALAVRSTTREHAHLSTGTAAAPHAWSALRFRLWRWGHALAVLPFALFVLASGWPMAWAALRALEGFPETFNPGYFVIKAAALLLALLIGVQAVLEALAPAPRRAGP